MNKEQFIRVIAARPHEQASVMFLRNELEAMQEYVNGYIECYRIPWDPEVIIVCNEEGKLRGMDHCRMLFRGDDRNIVEQFVGPIFVARDDGKGNIVSLTDDQAKRYYDRFRYAEYIDFEGHRVPVYTY